MLCLTVPTVGYLLRAFFNAAESLCIGVFKRPVCEVSCAAGIPLSFQNIFSQICESSGTSNPSHW